MDLINWMKITAIGWTISRTVARAVQDCVLRNPLSPACFHQVPVDMLQVVLIMKCEKVSKMHQISVPEGEVRSILLQR
jgi:hypothetical protein